MRRHTLPILLFLTLPPALTTLHAAPASSQTVSAVPQLMNFQGRLTKPDGTPVADGNYSVTFSLWSAASAGTQRWSQTVSSLGVRNGAFAVLLSGFPAGTFSGNLWLQIKVGADAPLAPRQQLVTVAYAMKADSIKDGGVTSASLADGAVTSTKLAPGLLNGEFWRLGGNAGTTPASSFLGTTDNQPLAFRTNNAERMRLTADGNLGLTAARYLAFNPADAFTYDGKTTGHYALGWFNDTWNANGPSAWLSGYGGVKLFSNGQVRVSVTQSGDVGVGTNSPSHRLTVQGGNNTLRLIGPGIFGSGARLNFGDENRVYIDEPTDDSLTLYALNGVSINSNATVGGSLGVNGTFGAASAAVTGSLGVGTTTPTSPLHIVDARASGWPSLRVDAASTIGTWLRLNNTSAGGRSWNLISTGSGNGESAGKLLFNDQTGGGTRMTLDQSGNLGVGTSSPAYRLHVNGTLAVSNLPFGDYRNVQWNDATGQFFYDNSSRKHKRDITPLADDFEKLLQAVPMTYTRPGAPGRWEIGFIAEDFHALGLGRLVDYGQDGVTPEGINYEKICLYLTAIARKQADALKGLKAERDAEAKKRDAEMRAVRGENAEMKARLEALEAAVAELRGSKR